MFEGLYFEYPKVFSFLVIFIACEAYCKIRSRAIYFPHIAQLTKETAPISSLMWLLKWLGITLLILAMMSPVRDEVLMLEPEKGADVVFIVPSSKALAETGFEHHTVAISRFSSVKKWINNWSDQYPNSSYGLVVASQKSYIASPLTSAKKPFQLIVNQLSCAAEKEMTAYETALFEALQLFKVSITEDKVLVMITTSTDLRINKQLQKELRKSRAKLYIIAIVTKKRDESEANNRLYSGRYYEVATQKELDDVYQTINKNEKLNAQEYNYTFKEYYYFYPLFFAFFVFLIYVYLRNRRGDV